MTGNARAACKAARFGWARRRARPNSAPGKHIISYWQVTSLRWQSTSGLDAQSVELRDLDGCETCARCRDLFGVDSWCDGALLARGGSAPQCTAGRLQPRHSAYLEPELCLVSRGRSAARECVLRVQGGGL